MKTLLMTIFLTGIILLPVKNNFAQTETEENTKTESLPTLQSLLDEKKAAFELKASDEKKKIYSDGTQAVVNSGVLENALNNGDTAPDFLLKNSAGEEVTLYSYLEKGPVVLTWYRGGWCPYCNITLRRLQQELPNFQSLGASLIALTPELPDSSLSTSEKQNLEFEVLSDPGNKVAGQFGIVFKLTNDVADSYQKGFDLHAYNGDESNELPLAATYVIDTNKEIIYTFLDADYRNRAEPSDILDALKSSK
ncbi:MAG TPA: peroxiredoxin-like family protein [Ignavibacteria bacterium]|nr:peroxiredoxin-like family protein [Ignavibacteria bacterium]HQY50974.1 peroxiredoxin-like family protein [Ignavibacteria bacterium]HRA99679.1 peroxiredoxin-like family protein [Ignavibacteria bacterium]